MVSLKYYSNYALFWGTTSCNEKYRKNEISTLEVNIRWLEQIYSSDRRKEVETSTRLFSKKQWSIKLTEEGAKGHRILGERMHMALSSSWSYSGSS